MYGVDFLSTELGKRSAFYDRIGKFDMLSKDILKNLDYLDIKTNVDEKGMFNVSFWGIENCRQEISSVRGEFYAPDGKLLAKKDLVLDAQKIYSASFDTSPLSFKEILTGKLKLFATDTKGIEHEFYETGSNEMTVRYDDLSSYLTMLGGLSDITVLIGMRDEVASGLDEKTAKAFGALSLECSVYGKPGTSYLAVSGSGKHLELAVNHELSSKDKFADGTEYEMISGALKYGNVCSIVIGGEEYAYNKRGFNIVVYDEKQGKVIDRALYDVYRNTIKTAMTDDTVSTGVRYNEENKTCDIWMTGSIPKVLTDKPVYAYIYTWDKDHPAMLSRIEMKKGRYGIKGNADSFEYFFMKDFDVSAYDPSSFGVMIYVTSSESGVVQYKCRTVYDLTSKENRDRALPQGVTLTEA